MIGRASAYCFNFLLLFHVVSTSPVVLEVSEKSFSGSQRDFMPAEEEELFVADQISASLLRTELIAVAQLLAGHHKLLKHLQDEIADLKITTAKLKIDNLNFRQQLNLSRLETDSRSKELKRDSLANAHYDMHGSVPQASAVTIHQLASKTDSDEAAEASGGEPLNQYNGDPLIIPEGQLRSLPINHSPAQTSIQNLKHLGQGLPDVVTSVPKTLKPEINNEIVGLRAAFGTLAGKLELVDQVSNVRFEKLTLDVAHVKSENGQLAKALTDHGLEAQKTIAYSVAEFQRYRNATEEIRSKYANIEHRTATLQTAQFDHFTAIQRFVQDINEMKSDITKYGLKLATLQVDFLNASLGRQRDRAEEMRQELQIRDLKLLAEQSRRNQNDLHVQLKQIHEELNLRATLDDLSSLQADIKKLTSHQELQSHAIPRMAEQLQRSEEAIIRLESQLPHDCSLSRTLISSSGIYLIKPTALNRTVLANCQIAVAANFLKHSKKLPAESNVWTVIQRRDSGLVDFNRPWTDYAEGFGDPGGSHWLGNRVLSTLTASGKYRLRILMWDIYDRFYFAEYGMFHVEAESNDFALSIGEYAGGNATDALSSHNGARFSTVDNDNDDSSTHCAYFYVSGWWYNHCQLANLNGNFYMGMIWFNSDIKGWIQLRKVEMMIRPN